MEQHQTHAEHHNHTHEHASDHAQNTPAQNTPNYSHDHSSEHAKNHTHTHASSADAFEAQAQGKAGAAGFMSTGHASIVANADSSVKKRMIKASFTGKELLEGTVFDTTDAAIAQEAKIFEAKNSLITRRGFGDFVFCWCCGFGAVEIFWVGFPVWLGVCCFAIAFAEKEFCLLPFESAVAVNQFLSKMCFLMFTKVVGKFLYLLENAVFCLFRVSNNFSSA